MSALSTNMSATKSNLRGLAKSMTIVLAGAIFMQALTILSTPLVTRVYGPSAYGIASAFMSVIAMFGALSCFTYPGAIIVAKSDEAAAGLIRGSALVGLTTTALVALGISAIGSDRASSLALGAIVPGFSLLVPLFLLTEIPNQIFQHALIRRAAYAQLARVGLVATAIAAAVRILVGLAHPSAQALIGVNLLTAVMTAALFFLTYRAKGCGPAGPAGLRTTVGELKRFADFPLYRLPQSLLSSASAGLPSIMIVAMQGAHAGGLFALSNALVNMPVSLISKSYMDVLTRALAEETVEIGAIRALLRRTTLLTLAAGAAVFGGLSIVAGFLLIPALGAKWAGIEPFVAWSCLNALAFVSMRPAFCVLVALRRQDLLLGAETAVFMVRIATLAAALKAGWEGIGPVALMSAASSLAYFAMAPLAFRAVRSQVRQTLAAV